jgi:hypothetical protein
MQLRNTYSTIKSPVVMTKPAHSLHCLLYSFNVVFLTHSESAQTLKKLSKKTDNISLISGYFNLYSVKIICPNVKAPSERVKLRKIWRRHQRHSQSIYSDGFLPPENQKRRVFRRERL